MVRKGFLFLILLFYSLVLCSSQECKQYNKPLIAGDFSFLLFYECIDEESKIIKNFYIVEKNTPNRKILELKNEVFFDREGAIIIDLSKQKEKLYGVKIEFSYPSNKRYRPGLIITPYLGSQDSVGDSFVIQVTEDYLNFEKRTYNIP